MDVKIELEIPEKYMSPLAKIVSRKFWSKPKWVGEIFSFSRITAEKMDTKKMKKRSSSRSEPGRRMKFNPA